MDVAEIVKLLIANNKTVAVAESCTGGMISSSLVSVSGVSECFAEGYVTYANEAKIKNVSVSPNTLAQFGAVSEETAGEMARGVRQRAGADFGLATTGIAGPDGGSDSKPVGLVFIACAFDEGVVVKRHIFTGNRQQIRSQATEEALRLLEICLQKREA